jgi:hypothetical protein
MLCRDTMASVVIGEGKYYLAKANHGLEGLSCKNLILIHSGECYIGAPLSNIDWTRKYSTVFIVQEFHVVD